MHTDQPRDQIHHQQPHFKQRIRLAQFGQELLGKSLGVIDEVKCTKVERNRILLIASTLKVIKSKLLVHKIRHLPRGHVPLLLSVWRVQ